MKQRLPLWETTRSSDLGPTLKDIYPDQPPSPAVPLVCVGSTRGPTVAEPSAQIFFEALSPSNRIALLKLTSPKAANSTPEFQPLGNTIRLTASIEQLPESLALLLRAQPQIEFLVVNVFAWHLFYETALSVLIGPLPREASVSQPHLERVSLWMPEARAAVLTGLARNASSFVAQAC